MWSVVNRAFSPSKFFRNEIRDKYYPLGELKFGCWKNGRCGLYILYLAVKIANSPARWEYVGRVNKMDGKINGGTMIPRFLFWNEVKVTFLSIARIIYLTPRILLLTSKCKKWDREREWGDSKTGITNFRNWRERLVKENNPFDYANDHFRNREGGGIIYLLETRVLLAANSTGWLP